MGESVRLWRKPAVVYGIVDGCAVLVVGRLMGCSGIVLCLTSVGVAWQNIGDVWAFARRSHDAVRLALALLVLFLTACASGAGSASKGMQSRWGSWPDHSSPSLSRFMLHSQAGGDDLIVGRGQRRRRRLRADLNPRVWWSEEVSISVVVLGAPLQIHNSERMHVTDKAFSQAQQQACRTCIPGNSPSDLTRLPNEADRASMSRS
jgi:hypothetical protein